MLVGKRKALHVPIAGPAFKPDEGLIRPASCGAVGIRPLDAVAVIHESDLGEVDAGKSPLSGYHFVIDTGALDGVARNIVKVEDLSPLVRLAIRREVRLDSPEILGN